MIVVVQTIIYGVILGILFTVSLYLLVYTVENYLGNFLVLGPYFMVYVELGMTIATGFTIYTFSRNFDFLMLGVFVATSAIFSWIKSRYLQRFNITI